MAASTVPTDRPERVRTAPIRIGLTAITVVVLLTAAFALGRSTGHTTRTTPAIQVPAVQVPVGQVPAAAGTTSENCHLGRPC